MSAPYNVKQAHAMGLVWVNVDLNRGKTANVARVKLCGALSPALAEAMEHVLFGDVQAAIDTLEAARKPRPKVAE